MILHLIKGKAFAAVTLVAVTVSVSGCQNYLSRHEGVTSFAGDSLATNEAISVVDTWPDGFDDTSIPTDGQRQSEAIEKYKSPKSQTANQAPASIKLVTGE